MAAPLGREAWTGNRVRQAFLDFFKEQGHTVVPSSSVVPHNDPTLLFANAGMNQFKPIFLGTVDPTSDFAKLRRATDTQKCIRAGGKHNDLDDVGRDVYHHTFFEMLGNWSFGDYFKAEAIEWAWTLLTEVYKLDPERIYATYFGGDEKQGLPSDDEARTLWEKKLPTSRVLPFGCADNFWEMGDQGPCGPCSELHYDRIGGRDAAALVNMDDPDVLEIWNIVFIQYNREADSSLKPLPAKHVDTGMGMERVTSILQNKRSNYATDLFGPIFEAIQALGDKPPYQDRVGDDDIDGTDMAYRVVADHIRTLSFAIADGAGPGAEGRDYVLRRVLRRAVRYGQQKLGAKDGFFCKLVDVVVDKFGGFYPELRAQRDRIFSVIQEEETSFSRTLQKGIRRYKAVAEGLRKESKTQLEGKVLFELWDTYGFPPDLTELMAEEDGLTVDHPGFQAAMDAARELSRAGQKKGGAGGLKFEAAETAHLQRADIPVTDDSPKFGSDDVTTTLLQILAADGTFPDSTEGIEGPVGLVLEQTSFYAEQGGQVTDYGTISSADGGVVFNVEAAQVAAGYVLHKGNAPSGGVLKVGDSVTTSIDQERRACIAPNHTFTHVLNLALKSVLGDHVAQKGSIVLPDRLRFDFSHPGVIEPAKLQAIEEMCLDSLAKAHQVYSKEVPLAQARDINGLRAVFGEVYPDPVRVVSIGRSVEDLVANPSDDSNAAYSVEFCGGTHLADTSGAKAFALLSEEGIAKGVRRVVAVTGAEASEAIEAGRQLQQRTADAQKLPSDKLEREVAALKRVVEDAVVPAPVKAQLRADVAALSKALLAAQKDAAAGNKKKAIAEAVAAAGAASSEGAKFVALRVDVGPDAKALQEASTAAQKEHPELPLILFSCDEGKGKALVFAGVPAMQSKALHAGQWLNAALAVLGGKGGGKPVAAQGSGPKVEAVEDAMAAAREFAQLKLQ
mmetsp:Transcript_19360/g.58510  ORF Transcript_19360/g.58510 Transcript_19360/m.58510 type:complete len:958 (+) Transcript_19360:236-3109(+)